MSDTETLKKYIEGSGLDFRQNSVSYIFTCPRCNKKGKLFLRKRDGRFVCWVCKETDNFQGRPEYALAELQMLPVATIRSKLYGEKEHVGGVRLDLALKDFFGEDDTLDADAVDATSTIRWPWDYYAMDDQRSRRGREYLEGRGIPLELSLEYGLRYCPERRRIAFPVMVEGRLVGYQERTVVKETKTWNEELGKYSEMSKVLSSKGIPRDRLVMFADRMKNRDHVVLCEGPIDALKAHSCGGNVAAMGKAVSRGQVAFLRNQGVKKVYLALDPDAADETRRLVREFGDETEVYLMHPDPGYKDLGAMSIEGVKDLFLRATRVNSSRLFVFLDRSACIL